MLQDKRKLRMEVCKLKINFHMIILMRMQMINPNRLDPKIGTENPKRPESECKDGGNTSKNVPGDNVGTDVISPREGASDG
jgi:hypothetical protein